MLSEGEVIIRLVREPREVFDRNKSKGGGWSGVGVDWSKSRGDRGTEMTCGIGVVVGK
jgi:hypothetical protein